MGRNSENHGRFDQHTDGLKHAITAYTDHPFWLISLLKVGGPIFNIYDHTTFYLTSQHTIKHNRELLH